MAIKLLNHHHFQYAFTKMSGFWLIWITNPYYLKIFELWWIMAKQKFFDENQCFDSKKSIHSTISAALMGGNNWECYREKDSWDNN